MGRSKSLIRKQILRLTAKIDGVYSFPCFTRLRSMEKRLMRSLSSYAAKLLSLLTSMRLPNFTREEQWASRSETSPTTSANGLLIKMDMSLTAYPLSLMTPGSLRRDYASFLD